MSLFENIYPTEYNVPGHVKNFQDDVYGIGALCKAIREMINGETDMVIFKTGNHDGFKWVENSGFILTMETMNGVRVFMEGNSSVVASHYGDDATDPARVVGVLVANFGSGLFRQKV